LEENNDDLRDQDLWRGMSSVMPEPFMNRQDVGNVLHRGISLRSLMNAQASIPWQKCNNLERLLHFCQLGRFRLIAGAHLFQKMSGILRACGKASRV
jgi:hypothetical protein